MILPYMDSVPTSKDDQDEVLNRLYSKMFIIAYSIMRNKQDALDIVQEAWVKILENIDSLKNREKFEQWAKAIVSNTAINAVKKRYTRNAVRSSLEQAAAEKQLGDEEIDRHLLEMQIRGSLEQLSDVTKQILTLKLYRGMRDQEIAELMKMPLGTVKARIHRGKEQIRHMLVE